MQSNSTAPNPAGPTGYASEHRFRLLLLACALTLTAMLAAVYSTVGFAPIWASHALPAAP
jgi:hypothetical protein